MENGLFKSLRSRFLRNRRLRLETLEARQLLAVQPLISELMPANAGVLADQDGDHSDWIELLNPSSNETIDLAG
jgi:hypothetical protein